MNTAHYHNTQQQLEATLPLLEELSDHLVTADVLPIKQIILTFINEIALPTDTTFALDKLILSISNYLITYSINLTTDNTKQLKKLYELMYI